MKRRAKRPARKRPGVQKYRTQDGEKQRRLVIRDPEAQEWWAYRGRTGGERPKPGCGKGCKEGREAVHKMTVQCGRKGCGALVDWRAMKTAAYDARRAAVAAGAGCTNPHKLSLKKNMPVMLLRNLCPSVREHNV